VFFIVGLALLFVLPSPWNVVGFVVSLVAFIGEVGFWQRRVKGSRVRAGSETLIGSTATVLAACRPDGQVRVAGEIWEARCADGADPGDTVTVVAREDLLLVVAK
jgi:membrane protein implicated in regulation of membrane protease activity